MQRPARIKATCAVVLLALGVTAGVFARKASLRPEATIGPYTLAEVDRVGTGHQRAERLAFADGGRRLAVTCPRYNRVVIYRVTGDQTLELDHDVELEGRPVAVCAARDRFYVLQRPPGDTRHVVPGWWETFDFEGRRVGSRQIVGFYPDDMALTPDEKYALVLTSGRAEGGANRPAPALEVRALEPGPAPARAAGRIAFDDADDPARVTLSQSGRGAVVTLLGSNEVAAVDCSDPVYPRLVGRAPLPDGEEPYPSRTEGDAILMPVGSKNEALWLTPPPADYVACTLPQGSALRVYHAGPGGARGELPLRGPMNLGKSKPTGLAFAPERGLIAVANRSGGVHLVALRTRAGAVRGNSENLRFQISNLK